METLNLRILSPTSEIFFEEVTKVSIESNNDSYEIFPEHSNLSSSLNLGKINIFKNTEEIIYQVYSASLKFNNDENQLNIYCLDYAFEKDIIFSIEEINKTLKKDPQSLFYLQLLENNEIVLERDA